jgi:hypothetical protein
MNAPRFTTSMASALKLPGTGDAADIRNGGRATEGRDMNRFFHILRDPLFLFLLIGGGFFLAYTLLSHRADRIEVTQAMQASLAADYEAVAGHKPDAAEQAKLVQEYVANELLFREAIARGMHLTDKATKQRLTDRLRFMLTGTPNEPTEADLIDYYATHLGSYRAEPQISFEHVFFANPPADPAGILARLNRGEQVSGGQAFLSLAEKATPGSWFGPVRSNRGMHFVRVSGRRPAGMMPYADIREQVRQDFIAAKTSGVIDAEVAKLERKYDVAIDR